MLRRDDQPFDYARTTTTGFIVAMTYTVLLLGLLVCPSVIAFTSRTSTLSSSPSALSSALFAKLSPLPSGLSAFERQPSNFDDQFRRLAASAVDTALRDNVALLEIDFPVYLCTAAGAFQKSKTQFDDLDNLSELNTNRDWSVQLAPMLNNQRQRWLVFPDDKECELAAKEWTGQRYRSSKFTSIRAACTAVLESSSTTNSPNDSKSDGFSLPWGSTLASTLNKLAGGDGILADSSTLDDLEVDSDKPRLHIVCQPGNGGPVEDWINVEKLHAASETTTSTATLVVNGALDKVRDGYYPAIFFPALASTVPFYKRFEAALYLKPINDKGVSGWLYRVYPEQWQVVLQTAVKDTRGGKEIIQVESSTVLVSNTRPTYQEAVQALLKAASKTKV